MFECSTSDSSAFILLLLLSFPPEESLDSVWGWGCKGGMKIVERAFRLTWKDPHVISEHWAWSATPLPAARCILRAFLAFFQRNSLEASSKTQVVFAKSLSSLLSHRVQYLLPNGEVRFRSGLGPTRMSASRRHSVKIIRSRP
jgi:hypothetical protein